MNPAPDTSMDTSLQLAHQRLSQLMVEHRCGAYPINLCYIEPMAGKLVVGITHLTPAIGLGYQRFLREILEPEAANDVPVQFIACQFVRHANKQNYNRPLIGGLGITCQQVQGSGSICIACSRNEVPGFVTCGHVVANAGNQVYQPRQSSQNNWLVGTTTVVSNYQGVALSDSAFVTSDEGVALVPGQIWQGSQAVYSIVGFYDAPQPGTAVSMQGASTQTAERSGVIAGKNVTVTFADGGTLQNQLLATYLSQEGDSGAPAYFKMGGSQVLLVGLNVGSTDPQYTNPQPNPQQYPPAPDGTYAIISPWSNVEQDLGLPQLFQPQTP